MEFLVIAHDRTDDEALAQRMVVRERRLAAARRTIRSGNALFEGATRGEEGRMVGPMTVVSFPARAAIRRVAAKRALRQERRVWVGRNPSLPRGRCGGLGERPQSSR